MEAAVFVLGFAAGTGFASLEAFCFSACLSFGAAAGFSVALAVWVSAFFLRPRLALGFSASAAGDVSDVEQTDGFLESEDLSVLLWALDEENGPVC